MAATAIHGTTQPTYTKRIVGSDIPPCEDSASEQPQQTGGQAHQATVVDNISHGTGPQI